ncbi:MAG: chemotaxis protein CheW [Deltaproteobacteria bacterium]|nr:chemotaxis protein CheW [Deltaproteobacteria bacterium]
MTEPSNADESTKKQGERARWEAIARAAAEAKSEGDGESNICELLSFRLAEEAYAIPVERVREIVRMRPLTPVPRVPKEVIGVVSLRGEIVEVVDLRVRLGLPSEGPMRRTRIIVLHGDSGRVTGLLVDEVTKVLRVPETDLRPAASNETDVVYALYRREDEFISLMDVNRVLEI